MAVDATCLASHLLTLASRNSFQLSVTTVRAPEADVRTERHQLPSQRLQ